MSSASTIWLASYPKSGNTWVRALISALTREGDLDLNALGQGPIGSGRPQLEWWTGLRTADLTDIEIDALRPRVDAAIDAESTEVRFRKIHDAYGPVIDAPSTRGVVYIVRDPRDVALSFAHHSGRDPAWAVKKMGQEAAAMDLNKRALHTQVRQVLGTWSFHVESWVDQTDFPVLLVRYENLKQDAARELDRITSFADLETTPAAIAEAVSAARFERLQEQESESGFKERPGAERKFFRRGVAGAWRDELEPGLASQIEADHSPMMERLGYELEPSEISA